MDVPVVPRGVYERKPRPLLDRVVDKIELAPDGCWNWLGAKTTKGYGQVYAGAPVGGLLLAHRVVFEWIVGSIPDGLQLDHVCRNHGCVNPDHLEAVTNQENTLRGLRGRMVTHCPQGHIYTAENTRFDKRGLRHCRTCEREAAQCRRDERAARGLTSRGTTRKRGGR